MAAANAGEQTPSDIRLELQVADEVILHARRRRCGERLQKAHSHTLWCQSPASPIQNIFTG